MIYESPSLKKDIEDIRQIAFKIGFVRLISKCQDFICIWKFLIQESNIRFHTLFLDSKVERLFLNLLCTKSENIRAKLRVYCLACTKPCCAQIYIQMYLQVLLCYGFLLSQQFWQSRAAPFVNERESTLKIVNRPDSNLMFFSFIYKWLIHLRFKINLPEKFRI